MLKKYGGKDGLVVITDSTQGLAPHYAEYLIKLGYSNIVLIDKDLG